MRAGASDSLAPGSCGDRADRRRGRGVRRFHIERIHYDVYYRLAGSPEYVEIVALWGSRRGGLPLT